MAEVTVIILPASRDQAWLLLEAPYRYLPLLLALVGQL